MSEFDDEFNSAVSRMRAARQDLETLLGSLVDADLQSGRRGGWTVAQVLGHVVDGELHYELAIRRLRGERDLRRTEAAPVTTVAGALDSLNVSRGGVLASLEGVDEETFYRLERVGGQDFSVLSVLENVELHDREHEAQIKALTGRV